MEASTSSAASPSALHLHAVKTPTFDDDGLEPPCNDDDDLEDFNKISIADSKNLQQDPMNYRFFGKSSGVVLVQTAIDLKNEYSGLPLGPHNKVLLGSKRPEFWSVRPVSADPSRCFRGSFHTECFSGNSLISSVIPQTMNSPMRISWSNLLTCTSVTRIYSCLSYIARRLIRA
jgi:hypothetical protein